MKHFYIVSCLLVVLLAGSGITCAQSRKQPQKPKAQSVKFPVLPQYGKSADDFVPPGWEIRDTVAGDLNKDNEEDIALILESEDSVKVEEPYSEKEYTYPRILAIIFKKGPGYELKLQHNTFILLADDDCKGDPYDSMTIEKGVLRLKFSLALHGQREDLQYILRYQLNDFYLIGATNESWVRTGYDGMDVNFVTGKYITKQGETEEDASQEVHKVKPKQLKKLRDIKAPGTVQFEWTTL